MLPLALLLTAVFPIAVTVAACYDLLTMQIPNRFPAAIALAFLALALLAGLPLTTLGIDLLLGLGVLLTTFILFAFGFRLALGGCLRGRRLHRRRFRLGRNRRLHGLSFRRFLRVRQLAVQQQVAGFHEARMFGEVADRIAAMQ